MPIEVRRQASELLCRIVAIHSFFPRRARLVSVGAASSAPTRLPRLGDHQRAAHQEQDCRPSLSPSLPSASSKQLRRQGTTTKGAKERIHRAPKQQQQQQQQQQRKRGSPGSPSRCGERSDRTETSRGPRRRVTVQQLHLGGSPSPCVTRLVSHVSLSLSAQPRPAAAASHV